MGPTTEDELAVEVAMTASRITYGGTDSMRIISAIWVMATCMIYLVLLTDTDRSQ